uniref:DUF4351 domain-containing protein n=1 Tax=Candidatus Kentrum sp. DK TaxID=2126562 RepID=A0A450SMX7_9GAMM|nr:MAG: hypothetical protein BECKDK2373B_GA0170837_10508 [Candidatus Kentron sp. DK]
MRLLNYKFGPLPATVEERIDKAKSEELALWERRILSAQTLDAVFDGS